MKAHDPHDLDALEKNLLAIKKRCVELDMAEDAPIHQNIKIALMRIEALRQTEVKLIDLQGPVPFGLFVEIHETDVISGAFSSWFRYGMTNRLGEKGIVGAAHSVEAWPNGHGWKPGMDRSQWPEWTKKYRDDEIIMRPGGLDIVTFGVVVPAQLPPDIRVGDRVAIMGYPAGVTVPTHVEVRTGYAYMERDEDGLLSWIIVFDNGERLAMGGMSGGVVVLLEEGQTEVRGDEQIVATLITQNSRTDVGQGQRHSSDVTEMRDAIRAMEREKVAV